MNHTRFVSQTIRSLWKSGWMLLTLTLGLAFPAAAQETLLQLDPGRTVVKFTLGDVLHTVHGSFALTQGSVRFDPTSGRLSGEIVVDAQSGQSGNGMRDRKMHKEILESARYPDISFRPDRVEGTVAAQGKSSVQVHGVFTIHGTSHELTVPAEVEMAPEGWRATLRFAIPYVKWGLKNPSTLFLRVSESVEIDLTTSGNIVKR